MIKFIRVQGRRRTSIPMELPAELEGKSLFELGKLGWFPLVDPDVIPEYDPDTQVLEESNYILDFHDPKAVVEYVVRDKYPAGDRCPQCMRELMESDEEERNNNVIKMSMAAGTLKTADTI